MQTRLASLFRRGRYERELDSELRFHLDMLTEQNIRLGLAPDQARRAALLTFGEVDRVKDDVRDTWLSRMAETVIQDARYGLRSIARSRGFACVIVLTMGLGIGANAAIFSVVNGVLLKPLPYADGHELVALWQHEPLAGNADIGFSYKEILDYRTARSLESVVEFHNMWFILLGRSEPQRVSTGVVSANFFDVLGVTPMFGRTFVDADDKPGAPAVLVLSHAYWKSSFAGDPTIVGKVFQMNDRPHQVIGILPPVPQYPADVDVYMPTSACPFRSDPRTVENRNARMVSAFARLKDGVSLSKAQADLDLVAARLEQEYPDFYPATRGHRTVATSLQEEMTVNFRATLLVLLGTAGFVLLIVCASVANLMLARLVRREREIAVRSAMGATRGRLLRQLLTESTLLAILGGIVGLAIAGLSVDLLVAFATQFTARAAEISIDRSVLLYTLAISVATGLVVGSVAGLSGKLTDVSSLREGTRTTQSRHAMRSALIVVQVAASFMLLIGAGLTIRSLLKLQQVDPGIDTENILTMRIDLNFTKYPSAPFNTRPELWERIDEEIRNRPGVTRVGGAATFPLNERGPFSGSLTISGRELPQDVTRPTVDVRVATPDYFATVGQPVVSGRPFRRSDRMGQNRVVIINQTMARHYWPGADPLGARLSGDGGETWQTVVGVVADTRQQLNENPKDEVYVPMFQTTQLSTMWLVRSNVEPETMAREIRAAVQAVDPEQPVDNFRTLADVRSASIAPRKLTATLLGLFGLLALVITATGIAGVIAFSVNQRTQEFGVMMALGAPPFNVLAMVLRQGLQLVLIGLAIGLAGALVLTRMLTTLLFGIEPTDGITFVAMSMVLISVAALACLVPAKRAASVDPMIALRAV